MKSLHCTTCKFTLPVSADEAKAYAETPPMHCGAPMLADDVEPKPALTPPDRPLAKAKVEAEAPKPEEKKKEKRGFFGGKKK